MTTMREEGAGEAGGVMHCFTETWEVAARVPLDRLLIETDSPYLAPAPHRGHRNQPAYVAHVAEEVARLRGIAFEDVARHTTENFFRLFKHARPA